MVYLRVYLFWKMPVSCLFFLKRPYKLSPIWTFTIWFVLLSIKGVGLWLHIFLNFWPFWKCWLQLLLILFSLLTHHFFLNSVAIFSLNGHISVLFFVNMEIKFGRGVNMWQYLLVFACFLMIPYLCQCIQIFLF